MLTFPPAVVAIHVVDHWIKPLLLHQPPITIPAEDMAACVRLRAGCGHRRRHHQGKPFISSNYFTFFQMFKHMRSESIWISQNSQLFYNLCLFFQARLSFALFSTTSVYVCIAATEDAKVLQLTCINKDFNMISEVCLHRVSAMVSPVPWRLSPMVQ